MIRRATLVGLCVVLVGACDSESTDGTPAITGADEADGGGKKKKKNNKGDDDGASQDGTSGGPVGEAGEVSMGEVGPSTSGLTTSTTTTAGTAGTTGTTMGETTTTTTGGAASPLVPVDSGAGVTFEGGGYRLVVAAGGGKITEYSLDGENVLASAGTDLQTGSILWIAPQSLWGWPPPPAHNSDPYAYAIEGNEAVFTGAEAAGVAMTKRFAMTDAGTVSITYTLSAGASAVQASAWENSRLVPTLCFFGTGTDPVVNGDTGPGTLLEPTVDGAVSWVPWTPGNTEQRVVLADGAGWSGCATGPGGLLFLKTFPDIPGSAFAPGNGEIKIWWERSDFLELEQLGAYSSIAPGTPVTYAVEWNLSRLPADVPVAPGPALAALLPN